jgi:hypothetical protein
MTANAAVLSAEQATALAEFIREAIDTRKTRRINDQHDLDHYTTDLRALDRWLRALHRADEGLREHCEVQWTPRYAAARPIPVCSCGRRSWPCPDARRYTDAASDASDALQDLAGLYGVEVPA